MTGSSNRIVQIVAAVVILTVVARTMHQRFGTAATPAATTDPAATSSDSGTISIENDDAELQASNDVEVAGSEKPHSPQDPIGTLLGIGFKVAHQASEMGNDVLDRLAGLTVSEEKEIGREAWQETVSRHSVLTLPQQQSRIEQLAVPFLNARDRQDIEYTFTILNDDAVNAFAHLGGYVYVNRGLLDTVRNDDELGFVLGHEIAHVDRRHCVKNMTAVVRTQQATGRFGGSMASLAYQAISVGYSENFELDADQWSYRQLRQLGKSHQQSLSGLKMLEREFGSGGDHHAHGPVIIQHVEDHFRTHPRIADRINQLESLKTSF